MGLLRVTIFAYLHITDPRYALCEATCHPQLSSICGIASAWISFLGSSNIQSAIQAKDMNQRVVAHA
ncbi:uncharacterized protein ARMOST_10962 [Armillaria ostoyae]|uniref:Uncharacterized protein n=1 Tax=Armillaria ostoyae TaxID=47428 RepID=A0A284RFT1_ARMOS|nr:uncharacterized protein ARMOST_10962 [Armillaria ostoyae]